MSTPAERDDAIERLLKAMPADSSAAAAGGCLDADVLAGWAEGTLSEKEMAALTTHASTCARCQALLAAMVRTEPPAVFRPRGRLAWTLVRWGAPLSAAAALALWIAVDRDVVSEPASQRVEQAAASAAAEQAAPPMGQSRDVETKRAPQAVSTPPPRERDQGAKRRDRAAAGDTASRKEVERQSDRYLYDTGAATPATPPAVAPTLPAAAPTAAAAAPAPAAAAPAPPSANAAPTASADRPQASPTLPTDARAEAPAAAPDIARRTATPSQEVVAQIPGGGLSETVTTTSANDGRNRLARRRQDEASWVDVPSPDSLVRSRFTPTGLVERSTDGGLTWTRQTTGATAPLLAGTAPSPSVCWIVGRAGTVLRFTSESGWQRFTVRAARDPVAIAATDAVNATITLANGQRVTTTDGGASWRTADNHGHN